MALRKFRCPKCSRSFGMKAHLGRHMTTIHAAAGAAKKTAEVKRGPGRPKGSGTGPRPAVMSSAGVSGIVRQMKSYHADLAAQRGALDGQIVALESAIDAMGGGVSAVRRPGRPVGRPRMAAATAPRKRGRPKGSGPRSGSLKDIIAKVLSQRATALSPQQISQAVVKAGYKSKAQDLTKAVSNVLPDVKGVKRLGFGKYTV